MHYINLLTYLLCLLTFNLTWTEGTRQFFYQVDKANSVTAGKWPLDSSNPISLAYSVLSLSYAVAAPETKPL